MFQVELEGGKDYVFRVNRIGTGKGRWRTHVWSSGPGTTALSGTFRRRLGLVRELTDLLQAEADGVYYLTVTSDTPTEGDEISTGTYRLVTREPDDHGDTAVGATEVTVGGDAEAGRINYNDGLFGASALGSVARSTDADIDWFKFSLDGVTPTEQQSCWSRPWSRPVMILTTCPGSTAERRGRGEPRYRPGQPRGDVWVRRGPTGSVRHPGDSGRPPRPRWRSWRTRRATSWPWSRPARDHYSQRGPAGRDRRERSSSLLDSAMELIVGIDGSILLAATAAAKAAQETYVTSLETQLDVSGNVFTVTVDASSVDGTSRPMFEVIDRFGNIVGHGDGKESGNVAGTAFAANGPGPYYIAVAPAGPGTTRSRLPPATCRTRTTVTPIPMGPFDASNQSRPRPAASVLPVTRIPIALPSRGHMQVTIDGARDGSTARVTQRVSELVRALGGVGAWRGLHALV